MSMGTPKRQQLPDRDHAQALQARVHRGALIGDPLALSGYCRKAVACAGCWHRPHRCPFGLRHQCACQSEAHWLPQCPCWVKMRDRIALQDLVRADNAGRNRSFYGRWPGSTGPCSAFESAFVPRGGLLRPCPGLFRCTPSGSSARNGSTTTNSRKMARHRSAQAPRPDALGCTVSPRRSRLGGLHCARRKSLGVDPVWCWKARVK